MKIVGNVIEVKGSGILLLGSGKSSLSILLTKIFNDTYLVADDYCTVCGSLMTSIPKKGFKQFIPASQWRREPLGKIRNNLYETLGPEEIKRLGITSNLKKRTRYIDTICNRIAHKHICAINYIAIVLPPINYDFFTSFDTYNLLEEYFKTKEEKIKIPEIIKDLNSIFREYDIQTNKYIPKKNQILKIDQDSEDFDLLLEIIRKIINIEIPIETNFIRAYNIKILVCFYYDNIIEKAIDVYTQIEKQESIYKFIPIEEEYIGDPSEII